MGLGDILNKSWNEYTSNWKEYAKFLLVFRAIPALIFSIISVFLILSVPQFANYITEQSSGEVTTALPTGIFAFTTLSGLILILFYFFASGAITAQALKKEKPNYKNLVSEGKKVFWKYIGYTIVITIFLSLLFLLLIIPGIIFGIFWILGIYIYLDNKNTGILESLKKSRHMLKGRWWKTFGYLIIVIIIMIAISIIFGIITIPTEIAIIFNRINNIQPSTTLLAASTILGTISTILAEFVTLPFLILFFKNYYLELKKKKK